MPSPHPGFWKMCISLFLAKLRMPIVTGHMPGTQNNSDISSTERSVWSSFFWGKKENLTRQPKTTDFRKIMSAFANRGWEENYDLLKWALLTHLIIAINENVEIKVFYT